MNSFLSLRTSVVIILALCVSGNGNADSSSIVPASVFTLPTSNMQGVQALQTVNLFTSCMGTVTTPAQGLANSLMSSSLGRGNGGKRTGLGQQFGGRPSCPAMPMVSISMTCPGTDIPVDTSNLDCQTMGSNPSALKQIEALLQQNLCTADCKLEKLQAIQGEVSCLSAQMNSLSQQVASLQTPFTQGILSLQQGLQKIKNAEADEDAMIVNVNQKLNGDPISGAVGILGLSKQVSDTVAAMPADIQKAREASQGVTQAQNTLAVQIQMRTAALTQDCFSNRVVSTYRCTPGGPPVSPKDYLVCRYQQNQVLGTDGKTIEQNGVKQQQAQASAQGLSALLAQITGDTPSLTGGGNIPTTPDQVQQNMQQPLLVLSPSDVASRYGTSLSTYKIGNQTAKDFVVGILTSCNSRSTQEVSLEESNPNSQIGQAQYNLRQLQQETTQSIAGLFNSYNQTYAAGVGALTGQNTPLNLSACTGAALRVQVNCLDQIRTNMQGLLQGTTPGSAMTINLQGQTSTQTVSCQGLQGCARQLQTFSTNLTRARGTLTTFKQNYIKQANLQVQSTIAAQASALSAKSQMVNSMVAQIGSALASEGFSGAFAPHPMKGAALHYDQDGLVEAPSDLLGLIGQSVSPPLLDLNGGGLSSGMSGVASSQAALAQKVADIQSGLMRAENLPRSCAADRNRADLEGLMRDYSSAQGAHCHNSDLCTGQNSAQTIRAMQKALRMLTSSPLANSSDINLTSLNNGVTNFCRNPSSGQQNSQMVVNEASGACAAFQSSLLFMGGKAQQLGSGDPEHNMGTSGEAN